MDQGCAWQAIFVAAVLIVLAISGGIILAAAGVIIVILVWMFRKAPGLAVSFLVICIVGIVLLGIEHNRKTYGNIWGPQMQLTSTFDPKTATGVRVVDVEPDSWANYNGFRKGQLIVALEQYYSEHLFYFALLYLTLCAYLSILYDLFSLLRRFLIPGRMLEDV
jgi:energy-coupling factor transporter transmembrane protein EcfT